MKFFTSTDFVNILLIFKKVKVLEQRTNWKNTFLIKYHAFHKWGEGGGGVGACGTSNYRSLVCKFAIFSFTEPINEKHHHRQKCWLNVTWEETTNSIKVNKSRYKQCGVTPRFDNELVIQKTQHWRNQLRRASWEIHWPEIMQYTVTR